MRITGKFIGSEEYRNIPNADTLGGIKYATVELPPVDSTKIKGGDKLLVEITASDIKYADVKNKGLSMFNIVGAFCGKVVYHFPSPEKPSEAREEIKLPLRFSQEYCIDNYEAQKINALIDVVREIKERVK